MNPAFSSDPNRPEFQPGASPRLFGAQALTSDPNLSGPGTLPQTPRTTTPGNAAGGGIDYSRTGGGATRLPQQPPPTGAGPRPRPTGLDRYFGGGNIGRSAAGNTGGFRYNPVPTDNNNDYPWMQDTSIQWGGGPFGYLPIDYQPQNFDYYSQGNYGSHLAPWEYKYMQDTFTQNYRPNQPGYINTRDPNFGQTRG